MDTYLKIVKQMIVDGHVAQDVAEKYFPELKESEDEKIRKEIIAFIKSVAYAPINDVNRFIAWLEKKVVTNEEHNKEAEQEKRDFVSDGFLNCHVDFLDFKENNSYWLEYIGNDNYNVRSDNLLGKTYHITPCQLYTIFKKQTWLGKKKSVEEINGDDYGIDSLWHAQRILEKTLGKVEGYQTDDGILDHKAAITVVKKLYGKKSEWNEEDEWAIQQLESILFHDKMLAKDAYLRLSDWLKSLKDRVIPRPKEEWSEEDEHKINSLCYFLDTIKKDYASVVGLDDYIEWLKSLRPQLKVEWSEEERKRINRIIDVLDWAEKKGRISYSDYIDYSIIIKSLRPQKRWKPTDEELTILERTIDYLQEYGKNDDDLVLNCLLEQLKQL